METYRFAVSFDTAALKVVINRLPVLPPPPPPPPFPINVEQGISLITFTIEDTSVIQFPSNPLQWFNGSEPVFSPPWFLYHPFDNWHFSLWDFNSSPAQVTHQFELSVSYGGKIYSTTDPTIINEPPKS